jgi:phenylacetate-coenzyme A ligase PaaK-like adenylate-forming protein
MVKYISFMIVSFWNLFRSKKAINKLQIKKLRKTLEYAKKNVPMYRELYKNVSTEINTIEDLKNIPILEADFLRKQELPYYTSELFDVKDLILWGTSGSSGTPFQFYQRKEDAIKWQISFLRFLLVNGLKLWWRVGVVMRHNPHKYHSLMHRLLTFRKNVVPINLPVEEQAEIMLRVKPNIIYGITPAIEIIADWMLENNKCIDSARLILGMGILPSVEGSEKLKAAFGERARIISYYGANDVGSIGFFRAFNTG